MERKTDTREIAGLPCVLVRARNRQIAATLSLLLRRMGAPVVNMLTAEGFKLSALLSILELDADTVGAVGANIAAAMKTGGDFRKAVEAVLDSLREGLGELEDKDIDALISNLMVGHLTVDGKTIAEPKDIDEAFPGVWSFLEALWWSVAFNMGPTSVGPATGAGSDGSPSPGPDPVPT